MRSTVRRVHSWAFWVASVAGAPSVQRLHSQEKILSRNASKYWPRKEQTYRLHSFPSSAVT
eukprot:XP_001709908.1 Hypothetical protein GL50803_37878 [Giardia lamblia ATCC 50803]